MTISLPVCKAARIWPQPGSPSTKFVGVVSISTGDQVNVNGRQFVELVIADDGPGIPEEVMENIFNPVTSSKGREHAGLGLTIVRNLVSGLNGTISCRNKPKGGAEFVILLPRKTEQ